MLEVLKGVMGEERMKVWRETGSADSALELDGLGRFRLNAYKQMGEPAVVIRRINDKGNHLPLLNKTSRKIFFTRNNQHTITWAFNNKIF